MRRRGDGRRREATGDGSCGGRELGLGLGQIAACYIQWKCDQRHLFIDEWSKIVGLFWAEMGLHAFVHCLTLFFFFFISLQYGNNYNLNYMFVK
jgi:hypothetical protein